MPEINRIAIVVLNWNGADMIGPCLESLAAQSYSNYQIVVVDNQSTDNSRAVLDDYQDKLGRKLRVIFNGRNSGFAGGVNIALRYAISEGFWAAALFNNDAVADKDWLTNLAETLSVNDDVGIVTGLLLDEAGLKIDSTGDWYSIWGLAFPRGRGELTTSAAASGYVFGATGGASLYRTELFKRVGLFDERFFAYYEDVDISFRSQLAGWKVFFERSATAYHKQGETSKRIPGFTKYQMFKNLPILLVKNVPFKLLLPVGWRFVFIYSLMFLNAALRGSLLPAIKGVGMALIFAPVSLIERRKVQSLKRVSDQYINSILWHDLPPNQIGKLRRLIPGKHPAAPNNKPDSQTAQNK